MRKQYTAAFKTPVVQELLKVEKTLAQIAAEEEVHPTPVKNWRAEYPGQLAEKKFQL